MKDGNHLEILLRGYKVWNAWRDENPHLRPSLLGAQLMGMDLRGFRFDDTALQAADISGANLNGTYLRWADLEGVIGTNASIISADLRGADLSNGDFSDSDLQEAIMNGTRLCETNLRRADLRRADLSGADLDRTDLCSANLSEATLARAVLHGARVDDAKMLDTTIGWTVLTGTDMSRVQGLDSLNHIGPSSIGIDTIYSSQGRLPAGFLRACGVQDSLIDYLSQPPVFEFYSCFISYSAKDSAFSTRLYSDLQANGVRAWYFPEDATWGQSVWGEIDQSIRVYDILVVICSKHSLQSAPVLGEIERALQREDREHKHILFPIRIDDYIFDEWEHPRKLDVIARVIGDFTGWAQNAKKYAAAFGRLLRALRSENPASE